MQKVAGTSIWYERQSDVNACAIRGMVVVKNRGPTTRERWPCLSVSAYPSAICFTPGAIALNESNMRSKLKQLNFMAAAWGWAPLRARYLNMGNRHSSPPTCVWYVSGDDSGTRTHCALQINEAPNGQQVTYEAAVYAIRYRIYSGWHGFTLHASPQRLRDEGERLSGWMHYSWFASVDKRREYRRKHPECCGFTWRRMRFFP